MNLRSIRLLGVVLFGILIFNATEAIADFSRFRIASVTNTDTGFKIFDLKAKRGEFNFRGTIYHVAPNAPTIVAFHGFTANTMTWETLGKHLNKIGYNFVMINQLGHGTGYHQSHADKTGIRQLFRKWKEGLGDLLRGQLPHRHGGRHNAHMSMAAVKEGIELVHEMFGRRVMVLGHSFGGMTTSTALGGVEVLGSGAGISNPTSYEARLEAMRLSRDVVTGHMSIGMPGDFEEYPAAMKTLAGYLEYLFRGALFPVGLTEVTIPFVGALQPYRERDSVADKRQRKMVENAIMYLLENNLMPGFLEEWNTVLKIHDTPELFGQWVKFLSNGASGLNLDLVADFLKFSREYEWTKAFNPYIPSVFVMGEKDRLAHIEGTLRHIQLRRQFAEVPVLALTVEDVGHLAIVYGDIIAKILSPFVVLADQGGHNTQWYKDFVRNHFPTQDISIDLGKQLLKFKDARGEVVGTLHIDEVYEKLSLGIPQVKHKTRIEIPEGIKKRVQIECGKSLSPAA